MNDCEMCNENILLINSDTLNLPIFIEMYEKTSFETKVLLCYDYKIENGHIIMFCNYVAVGDTDRPKYDYSFMNIWRIKIYCSYIKDFQPPIEIKLCERNGPFLFFSNQQNRNAFIENYESFHGFDIKEPSVE